MYRVRKGAAGSAGRALAHSPQWRFRRVACHVLAFRGDRPAVEGRPIGPAEGADVVESAGECCFGDAEAIGEQLVASTPPRQLDLLDW